MTKPIRNTLLNFYGGDERVFKHSYFGKFSKDTKRGYASEITITVSDVQAFYDSITPELDKYIVKKLAEKVDHDYHWKDFRIEDPFGFYIRFTDLLDWGQSNLRCHMGLRHYVIFIPGLGDNIRTIALATSHWKKYNLIPIVHSIGWRDESTDFKTKFAKLLELIDKLVTEGNKVSIVGTSAGGSAALNAFVERKKVVNKVINVCGRLRIGPTQGFRSFKVMTATSSAFAESVKLCENLQNQLSSDEKHRVMTIHAGLGDELVPPETTTIEGVTNVVLPIGEHVFSIFISLTMLSSKLADFLQS